MGGEFLCVKLRYVSALKIKLKEKEMVNCGMANC